MQKKGYYYNSHIALILYMFLHFAVDFACFYFLMGTFSMYNDVGIGIVNGFLLYNTVAFGLQFIIGRYYEHRKCFSAAAIGTFLVMIGLACNEFLPLLVKDEQLVEYEKILNLPYINWLVIVLVILAVGNAFFHVGGGIDSLKSACGKSGRCGLFVSTGALGVAMGTYVGQKMLLEELPILIALVVGLILLAIFGQDNIVKEESFETNEQGSEDQLKKWPMIALTLCLVAVGMRSYVGMAQNVSFLVLFVGAGSTCFGKAMGGILADEFGKKQVGMLALVISMICFSSTAENDLLTIIGLVSFNVVMPITLYALYEYLPHNPGMAFGLNSLALLVGYTMYMLNFINGGTKAVVAATLFAAILLFFGLPSRGKTIKNQEETIIER